jgi:hypothetical protein
MISLKQERGSSNNQSSSIHVSRIHKHCDQKLASSLHVTLNKVTSYDDLNCHTASRASLWKCSPFGLIAAAAAAS